MKKKLLFVIGALGNGGAERSLVNLLNMLDSQKFEISLMLFEKRGDLINSLPPNIKWVEPPREIMFLSKGLKNKRILKEITLKVMLFRIKTLVRNKVKKPRSLYHKNQIQWEGVWKKSIPQLKGEYDVAISYLQGMPSYYILDKVTAKKKIIWIHTDYAELNGDVKYDKTYFEKADKVITISETCKEVLTKSFPTLINKFQVLYNMNPIQLIRTQANQEKPKELLEIEKSSSYIILSIGRLVDLKGFDMVIDAAHILNQRKLDFYWFIIGEGSLQKKLENQINKYNLQKRVIMLGAKRNPYVYMKNSDLIVQSSKFEGKSMVLDEAKILCKPIISTKYLSVSDQIEDGVNGILVNISAEDIANGVEEILKNSKTRFKLSNNLNQINHQLSSELKKYEELFND